MGIIFFPTNLMYGCLPYDLKDYLGDVLALDDCDDLKKSIKYIKGLGEEKVMEMIMEYNQDYALSTMCDYEDKIDIAKSVVWIVMEYGSSMIEGLDGEGLRRLVKVIAFQDICRCQYEEVMNQ